MAHERCGHHDDGSYLSSRRLVLSVMRVCWWVGGCGVSSMSNNTHALDLDQERGQKQESGVCINAHPLRGDFKISPEIKNTSS
jgi:hypothetical protein